MGKGAFEMKQRMLAAAAAALIMTGCAAQQASQTQSNPDESGALTTVRVAYMPNLGSAGSLFLGIEKGFFEDAGLEIQPYEFQGGPAEITAMASGDIDIAQIGHGAHALCIEGQAVVFQTDHTNSLSDVVVGNRARGVETPADLKGKTVAVASGTSSEIILHETLREAGLSVSDIKTVEMTVDGMTTAMIAGQVDACAAWSPNTITLQDALKDDYVSLGTNADFADRAVFPSSFICTKEYAQKNRDVLVKFSQAISRAHDYRLENQQEMARLLAKQLDAPEQTMLRALDEADWKTIVEIRDDMQAVRRIYETQQQVFLNSGRISQPVSVEDYVLFDIMQQGYEAFQAQQ